jgi:hypothetical protein
MRHLRRTAESHQGFQPGDITKLLVVDFESKYRALLDWTHTAFGSIYLELLLQVSANIRHHAFTRPPLI